MYSELSFGDEQDRKDSEGQNKQKDQTEQKELKTIYLTIDDGPGKHLESILQNLKNGKATFFLVGRAMENLEGYSLVRKALEAGHQLGNHSYSHPFFSRLSLDKAKSEIEKTDLLLEKVYREAGKINPKLFRFPFGDNGCMGCKRKNEHKREINSLLENLGYSAYSWNLDGEDWKYGRGKTVESILGKLMMIKSGDIILTHENVITARYIVPYLVSSGKYDLKVLEK